MSTLEQVGARLTAVVDALPRDLAARVAAWLAELVGLLAVLAEGSEHPSLLGALDSFTRAGHAADDLCAALTAGTDHIHQYLTTLGLTTSTGSATPPPPAGAESAELDVVRRILATMPSMDAEAAATGQRPRTRGRWLRDGHPHVWDSGLDRRSGEVRMVLLQLGILDPDTRNDMIVAHAEVRLAALMRMTGGHPRREVLIINNRNVCDKGRKVDSLNCQALLPRILGPGQELVVYTPTRTGLVRKWLFRGGA